MLPLYFLPMYLPPRVTFASIKDTEGNEFEVYGWGLFPVGPYGNILNSFCIVKCKSLDIEFTVSRDGEAIDRILKGFYGVKFNEGENISGRFLKMVIAKPNEKECFKKEE